MVTATVNAFLKHVPLRAIASNDHSKKIEEKKRVDSKRQIDKHHTNDMIVVYVILS